MGDDFRVPWFVSSDLDGLFGLLIDNLVNLLIIAATLMGVFHMPAEIVVGKVIPGCALAIVVGNAYYTFMARRLARKERRTDVTTLPYGISTPIMFAYLFLVIGPVYWRTQDAALAWRVGVASAFIGGAIELAGAFVGPAIRRHTPRPALLGTLAGIAIVWIALKPAVGIWENPAIGFVPLGIVLVGFVGGVRMPWSLPTGFVAIALGSAVAWAIGFASWAAVADGAAYVGLKIPLPVVGDVWSGLADVAPFLMVVIPMGIYNFIETMNNVESAAAAGDRYSTREAMIVDGTGTMLGAVFGGCFPTTVYIGHPGWKAVGARTGYALLNGVVVFGIAVLGLMSLVAALVPKEVAFVILLYIALVIGAQAVQTTAHKYAPAVMLAFVPHIAAYVSNQVDLALSAANTSAAALGDSLVQLGVHHVGLTALGQGAIITGLLLGAMAAFLIDQRHLAAAGYAAAAAVLSFFGFIHAAAIGWAAAPRVALGYALLAVTFAVIGCWRRGLPPAVASAGATNES
ncbi:MAG: regulator [Deltaproteobacteria bacterium]|jgi:AGZA family xanthine/uracil permease-like MFS transporter|nr:regulator [Deltaproteobacteria bacterium]MBW2530760.1 regulator [Deltaproteobacteria bacterium]